MGSMSVIWPYFFLSLLTAYCCDCNTVYEIDENGDLFYIRKDRFFFVLTVIIMSLFVGLRLWCNDTCTYLDIYQYLTPEKGNILDVTWSIGENPGLLVLNRLFKYLGVSNQNYLMIFSFFTNCTYLWFVRKYSNSFAFSVFLLWTMGVYLFTAAAIKQTTATALGIIGIHFCIKKKYIRFFLFIMLGALIHPYVMMFIIAPFVINAPWTKKTWYLLGIFAVVGSSLQILLRTIVNATTLMGETYSIDEFSGAGVNIFRLLVVWAPIFLSFLAKDSMMHNECDEENMIMNLSMLNAEIMFVALFGTANYFARLANYFLIFQTISVPWMICLFDYKNRKLLRMVVPACYFLYFIFANVILLPFNTYFAKMPLGEYLSSIF